MKRKRSYYAIQIKQIMYTFLLSSNYKTKYFVNTLREIY